MTIAHDREEFDTRLRSAALAYVRATALRTGGPVRYEDVAQFELEGVRIPLMDPQRGIRKPRMLDAALSFRTVFATKPNQRPYADERGEDGYQRYKWRGTDPHHPENVALRRAMQRRLPLIWFLGIAPGEYLPVCPVWLVAEEPDQHQFVVALTAEQLHTWDANRDPKVIELRRAYADRVVRERLHQPVFRAQVLAAYDNRCALCRLRHRELLDAAHIRADTDGGEPVVTNGIAMCKIHHAAFDHQLMGVRPDYIIEVRRDVLAEADGPTLRYALQGLHNQRIEVPRRRADRPDPDLLEERYEQFRKAG
ncbi:MAG TPA: HNH endonuclease, partial [Acidimicrobiales bacterium]